MQDLRNRPLRGLSRVDGDVRHGRRRPRLRLAQPGGGIGELRGVPARAALGEPLEHGLGRGVEPDEHHHGSPAREAALQFFPGRGVPPLARERRGDDDVGAGGERGPGDRGKRRVERLSDDLRRSRVEQRDDRLEDGVDVDPRRAERASDLRRDGRLPHSRRPGDDHGCLMAEFWHPVSVGWSRGLRLHPRLEPSEG